MLWLKRVLCGIVALLLIFIGMQMIYNEQQLWQAIGFCLFVCGIALTYIAIMQHLPTYNFWITLLVFGLTYALYTTKYADTDAPDKNSALSRIEAELEKSKNLSKNTKIAQHHKPTQKRKKSSGFNLTAYPKVSGSITVIQAHVFYINGRYIRLYGVDAPDVDQVCSNSTGGSYNCGEEASSWVRNWIDKNQIDCYLLKINPNGYDLATCIWGEYDIGAALVGAGWGIANTRETDIYRPYEIKAQSESSGLWQGSFYAPEDWRDIKRQKNDFTIKKKASPKSGGFFNFRSIF